MPNQYTQYQGLLISNQYTNYQGPSSNIFQDILLTRFTGQNCKGCNSELFYGILPKVNLVIYTSSPPNTKALTQIDLETSCQQGFNVKKMPTIAKGHNSEAWIKCDIGIHWQAKSKCPTIFFKHWSKSNPSAEPQWTPTCSNSFCFSQSHK